ncbi:hypothetical protein [Thermococcus henrietii]|uniref:hypothetical protein n=1 Tax=Thermococcus henrietii TaxID=2016361 RepID=UPI000C085962|nr:hypothetical protein [Thermococcus henrietii]
MVKAKFVVYYYEIEDEAELRKTLKGYLTLFSPDVTTLTDALLQVSYSSPKITVVKTPKAIYVAPGEYEVEGNAYEFLVSSENGLRKVAEEILGVKRLKLDTVVNIVQGALWALVLLLGYLGYKNDVLREASSYMIVLLALSWVIENFRRGYKKRERVRASAPHHASE